ncbi:MAG: hypothetical protein HC862_15935 [Scytonema sp. RU_4_4]|nr:hypothetical protein [Scytonema sp. RU_4_4]
MNLTAVSGACNRASDPVVQNFSSRSDRKQSVGVAPQAQEVQQAHYYTSLQVLGGFWSPSCSTGFTACSDWTHQLVVWVRQSRHSG